MANQNNTTSFVLRFTQNIYQNDGGEDQVQWRGKIQHVQGGDERRFSELEEAIQFIQSKLTNMTMQAVEDKSPEEQEGILTKSFSLWRKFSTDYSRMVKESLKDPRAGMEKIQEEIQEQVASVGDRLSARIDPDAWKPATKADVQDLQAMVAELAKQVAELTKQQQ